MTTPDATSHKLVKPLVAICSIIAGLAALVHNLEYIRTAIFGPKVPSHWTVERLVDTEWRDGSGGFNAIFRIKFEHTSCEADISGYIAASVKWCSWTLDVASEAPTTVRT